MRLTRNLTIVCGICLVINVDSFVLLRNPFLSRRPTSPLLHSRLLLAKVPDNRARNVVKEDVPLMNEQIKAPQLRVVAPNPGGKDVALGVMSRVEALAKAKEMGGLDLILINDKSDPPVCKIVDYSKFRYTQEKKAKEVKKNSKATEVKEVKMSYNIDVHDYDVRKKSAARFLKQGNRVKCTVMFRGREVQHDKLGFELLEKLGLELDPVCIKEGKPKREGKNLSLILSPRAELLRAVNEGRKAEEKAKKKKKDEEKSVRSGAAIGAVAAGASAGAAAVANGATLALDGDIDDEDEEDDDDDDDDSITSLLDDEDIEDLGLEDDDDGIELDGAVDAAETSDDDDDDEDDDDDGDDVSLDALLGSDELSNELFGKSSPQ